jgi:peptidyl-tRNA hydrolase, PTH1 family
MASAAPVRIVLGLGNPGAGYDGTRHNAGFQVVDALAARLARPFVLRGRALVATGAAGGQPFVLAKPQTFMNNSGRAARDLLTEHGEDAVLLVACDDFHLPLGRLRCRASGSDGGQKGLASVNAFLAGRDVPRLRLGIGEPTSGQGSEDYVLRPFKRGELAEVEAMVARAADCLQAWLEHGDLTRLINAANAPPPGA